MTARQPLVRKNGRIQQLPAGDTLAGLRANFGCTFDGGGAGVAVGSACDIRLPYACTLDKLSLVSDTTGSIVIDVRVDTFANYPPTDADSIAAAAKPTLATSNKTEDSTLAGWSKDIALGSVVRFVVESSSGIGRVTLALEGTRT